MRHSWQIALSLAWASGCLSPVSADAEDLQTAVSKLPPPQNLSAKSLVALEYCIGVGMGDWLPPITLHGEGKVLLYSVMTHEFGFMMQMLVEIRDDGSQRSISLRAEKAWRQKMETLIQSCL